MSKYTNDVMTQREAELTEKLAEMQRLYDAEAKRFHEMFEHVKRDAVHLEAQRLATYQAVEREHEAKRQMAVLKKLLSSPDRLLTLADLVLLAKLKQVQP